MSKKRDVIQAAQQRFAVDPTPFEKLLDIREERIKPREVDAVTLLDSYLQGIAVVIDAVFEHRGRHLPGKARRLAADRRRPPARDIAGDRAGAPRQRFRRGAQSHTVDIQ